MFLNRLFSSMCLTFLLERRRHLIWNEVRVNSDV